MFCKNCGKEHNAKFCPQCGTPAVAPEDPAANPVPAGTDEVTQPAQAPVAPVVTSPVEASPVAATPDPTVTTEATPDTAAEAPVAQAPPLANEFPAPQNNNFVPPVAPVAGQQQGIPSYQAPPPSYPGAPPAPPVMQPGQPMPYGQPPLQPPPGGPKKKSKVGLIIGIVAVLVIGIIIVVAVLISTITKKLVNQIPEEIRSSVNMQTGNSTGTKAPTFSAADITIEEQVVVDQNDVKITAKSISMTSYSWPELVFSVENNSSEPISLSAEEESINKIMTDLFFWGDVLPGKTATITVSLDPEDLATYGIDNIGLIEFKINVSNTDTYDTIFISDMISIKTSEYDNVSLDLVQKGTVVYDADGITISYVETDPNGYWGTEVHLQIINTTDTSISLFADDVSVNGFMLDPYLYTDVAPGTVSNAIMTFDNEELELNDIEAVTDIEFILSISNYDNYDTLAETDVISITV